MNTRKYSSVERKRIKHEQRKPWYQDVRAKHAAEISRWEHALAQTRSERDAAVDKVEKLEKIVLENSRG